MNWRAVILVMALAAALLLSFWPMPEEEVKVVEPVRRGHGPAKAAPAPAAGETSVRFAALAGNLFPEQTWLPPPPPAPKVKPVPAPPPAPPEFPFSYFGRWAEAGSEIVFLRQGDRPVRVKLGDVVAGAWRLERIEAGGLVFIYLPLNMEKTLRTNQ